MMTRDNTFRGWMVRTNIEIDDKLLAEAMRARGFGTKRATVVAGLRLLIRTKAYRDILALRGKIHWVGNVDTLRKSKRGLPKGTSI
jgi:Arc/MetJ family transcription regulator